MLWIPVATEQSVLKPSGIKNVYIAMVIENLGKYLHCAKQRSLVPALYYLFFFFLRVSKIVNQKHLCPSFLLWDAGMVLIKQKDWAQFREMIREPKNRLSQCDLDFSQRCTCLHEKYTHSKPSRRTLRPFSHLTSEITPYCLHLITQMFEAVKSPPRFKNKRLILILIGSGLPEEHAKWDICWGLIWKLFRET